MKTLRDFCFQVFQANDSMELELLNGKAKWKKMLLISLFDS
jgi:hypothetical protein